MLPTRKITQQTRYHQRNQFNRQVTIEENNLTHTLPSMKTTLQTRYHRGNNSINTLPSIKTTQQKRYHWGKLLDRHVNNRGKQLNRHVTTEEINSTDRLQSRKMTQQKRYHRGNQLNRLDTIEENNSIHSTWLAWFYSFSSLQFILANTIIDLLWVHISPGSLSRSLVSSINK